MKSRKIRDLAHASSLSSKLKKKEQPFQGEHDVQPRPNLFRVSTSVIDDNE